MTVQTSARATAHRLAILLGSTALSFGMTAGAAFAQQDATGEQVVVTGSRANLANFNAPAPTAVIGLETINRTAVTSIATALDANPAFKGARSPQGTAQNQSSPAQATADLRGLGGQRTLVLINGVRMVPSAPASNLAVPTAVDLNLLPTIMIDHSEIVTGGASAQYGSDAVGGVVNLILRNNFNGLEIRGQAGESQYGDAQEQRIAAIAGTNFAGGKGHFVVAFDAVNSTGIGDSSKRPWAATLGNLYSNVAPSTVSNPSAYTVVGGPATLNLNNTRSALSSGGLLAISCSAALAAPVLAACRAQQTTFTFQNYQFTSASNLAPYNLGTLNNGSVQIGGDGPPINQGQQLVPAVKKVALYSRLQYDVTPSIQASLDLSYAYEQGLLNSSATGYGGATRISGTIAAANPYLPAAVAAAMGSAGVTSVSFNKQDFGIGGVSNSTINVQPRVVFGLKGDLGRFLIGDNWSWDAHATYGENIFRGDLGNEPITGNTLAASNPQFVPNHIANALNAVTVTQANVGTSGLPIGSIQCASTLTSPTNGCVPYNPFGPHGATGQAAAIAYMMADTPNFVRYQQEDAAANLKGEPFHTWAGPVAVSTGLEYRQESEVNQGTPLSTVNGLNGGNDPSYRGEFNVFEGYFETNIPLADHMPFAYKLNLDGAIRAAQYSDVGEQTTWKVGVNYEPIEGLRFRITESQDIRAPQIWELDSPGNAQTNVLAALINPQTGKLDPPQNVPQNSTAGNANVKPENASTETIGVVLTPGAWLNGTFSGLNLSVDWYRINIQGAITSFQGATAVPLCNAGQAFFCNMFTLNSAGTVISFNSPATNIGGVENEGIDFVLQYRKNLRDLGLPIPGRSTTALSGSYVEHIRVNPGTGGPTVDRAAENGQANQPTGDSEPWLRANLTETYEVGPFSTTLQVLYVSQGTLDNTYNTSLGGTLGNYFNGVVSGGGNVVPAYWKFDLGATYEVTPHLQLFAFVSNLLNVEPARSPYNVLNTYTSGAYYDKIGRALSVGFDYKY